MTAYRVISPLGQVDVLRHFIARERHREDYAVFSAEMHQMLDAGDADFLAWLQRFAKAHDAGNPVYTYTINPNGTPHHHGVVRWIRAEILRPAEVFSVYINEAVNPSLREARGNLSRVAERVSTVPALSQEFDLTRVPTSEEDRTIIGVARSYPDEDGTIELLDGAHRFLAMVSAGAERLPALLAEYH